MKTFNEIGIQIPRLLLPRKGIDLSRWAVIACDQFTSEPDYWQQVESLVGSDPSTYHLIFPEGLLGKPGEEERIRSIQEHMHRYLQDQTLEPREGILLVERRVDGRQRHGLMLCLDLERYDFSRGSKSLIRATEGTIVERLPPRMKVRSGAALELPHILVLIDDPGRTVIEPVIQEKNRLEKLYDFELMLGSGNLAGFAFPQKFEDQVISALRRLADPGVFSSKYSLQPEEPILLFAMGDGNHSLATARAVWEQMKPSVGMDHPARYALVEVENIHDAGLEFEPIHRVLFGLRKDLPTSFTAAFGSNLITRSIPDLQELKQAVDTINPGNQAVGVIGAGMEPVLLEFAQSSSNLPVGTLQAFLDEFIEQEGAEKIDYIHGWESLVKLGTQPGNAGFYVPGMPKSSLFQTVILDGALPRKSFSMGEAREKRFYMEARQIIP